jgi:hypothetical protein
LKSVIILVSLPKVSPRQLGGREMRKGEEYKKGYAQQVEKRRNKPLYFK